jgi:methionyl-tRNA formyltransferase
MKRYTCIGLLAREHGLAVARALAETPRFQLTTLFTHQRRPRSEDPARGVRADYPLFEAFGKEFDIPIRSIDSKAGHEVLLKELRTRRPDFLISVSWRYILPVEIIEAPRYCTINVHRGDLPKYAGAEPVKRALQDGCEAIAVCAHEMIEELDAGPILARTTHPARYDASVDLDANVERIKHEITPLFPGLVFEAIDRVLQKQ